jgi:hypothetical protein
MIYTETELLKLQEVVHLLPYETIYEQVQHSVNQPVPSIEKDESKLIVKNNFHNWVLQKVA